MDGFRTQNWAEQSKALSIYSPFTVCALIAGGTQIPCKCSEFNSFQFAVNQPASQPATAQQEAHNQINRDEINLSPQPQSNPILHTICSVVGAWITPAE